jgi:predicted porin
VSGAAFAQSNVTVYGVADVTFDRVKASGVGTNEPNHNRVSTNSSYIGFKGAEDMGGGMKAVFQFEGGVPVDTGGAFSFGRDSYVGVAGGFGTVAMGNLTGPTRGLGAAVDVFAGATGIGANTGIIGKFGGVLTGLTVDANGTPAATATNRSSSLGSMFDTRWKNAIAYISPSFSGLTATAAYVANENRAAAIDTSGYDLGLNYSNGPIMGGVTYNAAKVRNTAAALGLFPNIKAADMRLGGSYNLGVAKISALYDRVKVSGTGYSEKQNTWGLGVAAPVGAGKVVGQYYKAKSISGAANANTGATMYAFGYEHNLSKRTMLKATYAHLNNGDAGNYNFGVNSESPVTGATYSGFQFGVRHSF